MSFPFSVEGHIEIPIGSPDQFRYIKEGLDRWLAKADAADVHWEGDGLRFCGDRWMSRLIASPRLNRPLQGVDDGDIQFKVLPETVMMDYRVSFRPFPQLMVVVVFLVIAVSSIGEPRLLLLLPIVPLLSYAVWVMAGYDLQSNFRIAAIRGLADGAERELHMLQAR